MRLATGSSFWCTAKGGVFPGRWAYLLPAVIGDAQHNASGRRAHSRQIGAARHVSGVLWQGRGLALRNIASCRIMA